MVAVHRPRRPQPRRVEPSASQARTRLTTRQRPPRLTAWRASSSSADGISAGRPRRQHVRRASIMAILVDTHWSRGASAVTPWGTP
jgi:hypothetical protein